MGHDRRDGGGDASDRSDLGQGYSVQRVVFSCPQDAASAVVRKSRCFHARTAYAVVETVPASRMRIALECSGAFLGLPLPWLPIFRDGEMAGRTGYGRSAQI